MLVSRRVLCYMTLVALLACVGYLPIARAGSLDADGGLWVLWLMWSPALAAIATKLWFDRSLAGLGWRAGPWRYWALAALLPIGYGLVAYGAVWASGAGAVPNPEAVARWAGGDGAGAASTIARRAALLFALGVPISLLSAAGEEIGWRGFLVPELLRHGSFAAAAWLSGAIWFVYHVPVILFADYRGGAPLAWSLACFAAMVFGASFVFAWLRVASGSLWPPAILHAAHNVWVQSFFDPLTADSGPTEWWIGEFGAALSIAFAGLALLAIARLRPSARAPAS